MSNEPPKPESDPRILEYGRPKGATIGPVGAAAAMFGGFVIAVGIIGFIGFAAFGPTHPYFLHPPTGPVRRHWIPIILFFLASVSAIALSIYVWRVRPDSRWFLLGLLFGTAIMGLLEGTCYLPPS